MVSPGSRNVDLGQRERRGGGISRHMSRDRGYSAIIEMQRGDVVLVHQAARVQSDADRHGVHLRIKVEAGLIPGVERTDLFSAETIAIEVIDWAGDRSR